MPSSPQPVPHNTASKKCYFFIPHMQVLSDTVHLQRMQKKQQLWKIICSGIADTSEWNREGCDDLKPSETKMRIVSVFANSQHFGRHPNVIYESKMTRPFAYNLSNSLYGMRAQFLYFRMIIRRLRSVWRKKVQSNTSFVKSKGEKQIHFECIT